METLEDLPDIDAKEEFAMFSTEVLGKLGCGIEPQVFSKTKNNVFYEQVRETEIWI